MSVSSSLRRPSRLHVMFSTWERSSLCSINQGENNMCVRACEVMLYTDFGRSRASSQMLQNTHSVLVRYSLCVCVCYSQTHEFEILTLTDNLTCSADTQDQLLNHMQHIVKVTNTHTHTHSDYWWRPTRFQVVIPGPLLEAELVGVMGVSRLSLREGSGLQYTEVWVTIRPGEILIYPLHTQAPRTSIILNQHTCYSEYKHAHQLKLMLILKTN